MTRIVTRLKIIKQISSKEIKKVIADWFNPDRMQSEYNSKKDHVTHAAYILKLLIYYSTSDTETWRVKNHLREDYDLDPLTSYGYIYKSAANLAADYTQFYNYPCSRSQCQRVLDVLVKEGMLRRHLIGANDKGIPNRTYTYRLNFKRLGEVFPSLAWPLKLLRKAKKKVKKFIQDKINTPVLEIIEKLNTTYLAKKEKTRLSKKESPTTEDSLIVPRQKQRLQGIRSLRSLGIQVVELRSGVPDWRERMTSLGVKECDQYRVKRGFEEKCNRDWSKRKMWQYTPAGWRRWFDGYCANWVSTWQEQFGKKRSRYREEPPAYHRVLNDVVTPRDQLKPTLSKQDRWRSQLDEIESDIRKFRTTENSTCKQSLPVGANNAHTENSSTVRNLPPVEDKQNMSHLFAALVLELKGGPKMHLSPFSVDKPV